MKGRVNQWGIGALGSILGFFLSQFLTFYVFQKGLETSQKVEKIQLARDLVKDFYAEDARTFTKIRTAIESCEQLYVGFKKGGKFSNYSGPQFSDSELRW